MRTQRGGFAVGLVVGLLIGLGVALAVALYITKAPVPFINKLPQRSAEQDAAEAERNKNWDPNAALTGKSATRPQASASGAVAGASAADAAAPRPVASAVAADIAVPRSARDPASLPAGQPAPAASTAAAVSFFVQAGAYARTDDAEAQRAKLALLGLGAKITEREQSGRTVYRVRVGPFEAREDAEDAQGKLAAAGIDANLVRVDR